MPAALQNTGNRPRAGETLGRTQPSLAGMDAGEAPPADSSTLQGTIRSGPEGR